MEESLVIDAYGQAMKPIFVLILALVLNGCYMVEQPVIEKGDRLAGLDGAFRVRDERDMRENLPGRRVTITEEISGPSGDSCTYRTVPRAGAEVLCLFNQVKNIVRENIFLAECRRTTRAGVEILLSVTQWADGRLNVLPMFGGKNMLKKFGITVKERVGVSTFEQVLIAENPDDILKAAKAIAENWTFFSKGNGKEYAMLQYVKIAP